MRLLLGYKSWAIQSIYELLNLVHVMACCLRVTGHRAVCVPLHTTLELLRIPCGIEPDFTGNIITEMWPRQIGRNFVDDISKCILFNQMFAILSICHRILLPWAQIVRKKQIVKDMLLTDTRFFGVKVVEQGGYLYTLFSVLHFSLLFWL